jgi:hypothetical protein
MQDNGEQEKKEGMFSGVLFSRSVRASFASLSFAPVVSKDGGGVQDNKDQAVPILVRIQFFGQVKELRSFCRRFFRLGDMLHFFQEGLLQQISESVETEWNKPRLVINLSTIEQASDAFVVGKVKYWNMPKCQEWQQRYIPKKKPQTIKKMASTTSFDRGGDGDDKEREPSDCTQAANKCGHGGGLGKRLQGEYIANFLIHAIMNKLLDSEEDVTLGDPSTWGTLDSSNHLSQLRKRAIEFLNTGSGVIDAAGGSGHVSMALGLAGIQSTVVDARSGVGKLPGRDRKIWNKAVRKTWSASTRGGDETIEYCQPVVPFHSFRGWFGSPPDGVDSSVRHPDEEEIPVCNETGDLMTNCSAIIALHPDEATGTIVDVAVQKRIPFVIVPCCVFCRLFPARRTPESGKVVSTYDDLLCFLLVKDSSIQQAELPFQGKNTVLWSSF